MIEVMGAILTIVVSGGAVLGMGIKMVSAINRNIFLLEKIDQELKQSLSRTDKMEAWLRHHEISLVRSEVTYQPFKID